MPGADELPSPQMHGSLLRVRAGGCRGACVHSRVRQAALVRQTLLSDDLPSWALSTVSGVLVRRPGVPLRPDRRCRSCAVRNQAPRMSEPVPTADEMRPPARDPQLPRGRQGVSAVHGARDKTLPVLETRRDQERHVLPDGCFVRPCLQRASSLW
ncbi:hypothetical protein KL921_002240 [Ogataea angusta]|nr:hypothetical protein KL921_002240 [Ogataea angusta]